MSSTWHSFMDLTIFGESHGPAVGMVLHGIEPGIVIDETKIHEQLKRRAPGKSLTSERQEEDELEILSGIYQGRTTGSPVTGTSNDTPMLASNTTFPQSEKPAHTISSPKLGEGDRPQGGGGVCQTTNKHTPPTTLRVATPSNLEGEPADAIEEPILIVEPEPMETEEPKEIINIAPRVHRRNSTLLACTDGCTIITVPEDSQTQSTDLQQLLAEAFGSRNNEPLTLKTFELK